MCLKNIDKPKYTMETLSEWNLWICMAFKVYPNISTLIFKIKRNDNNKR